MEATNILAENKIISNQKIQPENYPDRLAKLNAIKIGWLSNVFVIEGN